MVLKFNARAIRFVLLVVCCLPGQRAFSDATDFKAALNLYNAHKFQLSEHAFYQLVKKDPQNNVYWFNLANSYFMLGKYEFAIRCYNHVIRGNDGLRVAARWYRAKALFKRGDKNQARKELREILNTESLASPVRRAIEKDLNENFASSLNSNMEFNALHLYQRHRYKQALQAVNRIQNPSKNVLILKSLILKKMNRLNETRELLKNINSREARNLLDEIEMAQVSKRKIWGYVNVSLGQESNVYQVPSYASPTSRLINEDFWGLGGELNRWGSRYLLLNYYGSLYNVFSVSSLQVVSHRVWLTYGYTKHQWHLQVGPYYELTDWGGQGAYDIWGAKLKLFKYVNHFQWGATADFGKESADQSLYSYLSGNVTNIRLFAGYDNKPIFAQLYVLAGQDGIGDITYTNGNVLPEADNYYGVGAQCLWRINKDWMASGKLAQIKRTFLHQAVPGGSRNDDETEYELRAIRTWTNQFSGYLSLSDTNNGSTLGATSVVDFNYNDQIVLLGVSWSSL